ncbi:MAG: helix-turn-helix domain-containing protein [Pseudomonadota bacterium]|nr:helix-turn-helix domain-containing protein [Pseudomonadota bacterium]
MSNALKLLSSFSEHSRRLGVTELAIAHGLPKSTVSRTMKELETAGYVERTLERLYQTGPELFRIGSLYRTSEVPLDRIDGQLGKLVRRFPASGYIAINRGLDCIILRMREGVRAVRFVIPEGSILPAFTVAIGKAILSRCDDDELRRRLPDRLVNEDPYYDLSRQDFLLEIAEGRARGWLDLRDMAGRGIDAVAIAVKVSDEETIGVALSFMTATTAPAIREAMIDSLASLGRELGAIVRDRYWDQFSPLGSPLNPAPVA